MRKLTRRLDRIFRQRITLKTIAVVSMGIILGLVVWATFLSIVRGSGQPGWLGIGGYSDPIGLVPRGGSLWDWLDLLLLPVSLSFIAYFVVRSWNEKQAQIAERAQEYQLQIAEQAHRIELQIATDAQKEATLNAYLDSTADYLVAKGERDIGSKAEKAAQQVAQLRTITALRTLDQNRVNILLQFLRDSALGSSLLEGAPLQHVEMEGVNLSETILDKADLSWANLQRAFLRQSSLQEALLYNANLVKALLIGSDLSGADLTMADLSEANLSQANLQGANLCQANLHQANLRGINLQNAKLHGTDMLNADLSEADLTGAEITESQLLEAKSLYNATLPNGRRFVEGQPIYSEEELEYTGDWVKTHSKKQRLQKELSETMDLPTNVWQGKHLSGDGNGRKDDKGKRDGKEIEDEVVRSKSEVGEKPS